MNMNNTNCQCCEWCDVSIPIVLLCRRYPPHGVGELGAGLVQFPRVFASNWCGEFKAVNATELTRRLKLDE